MAIKISSEITPLVEGADHPTHVDIYGQGGFMAIDTTEILPGADISVKISELVTFPRRKVGMLVFDINEQKYYRCTNVGSESTDGTWVFEDFTYIAEGRYVNETGDTMTGTLTGTDISLTGSLGVSGDSQLTRAFRNSGATFAPNEFITQNAVLGGNNIAISINAEGKIVVSYAEATFNPIFSTNPVAQLTDIKEIRKGIIVNNGSVTFQIVRGSNNNVNPVSAKISTQNSSRINGWPGDLYLDNFNDGFTSAVVSGLTFPNSTDWFKLGQTRISFTASITSDTQTTDGVPFTQTKVDKTIYFPLGWRLGGFTAPINSTTPPSKNDISTNPSNWLKFVSNNESTTETPNSPRTITYPITNPHPSGERLYFIHSSSQTGGTGTQGDSFGWSPRFFTDNNSATEGVFVELTTEDNGGPLQIGSGDETRYYRVWATTNDAPQTQTVSFIINGNSH